MAEVMRVFRELQLDTEGGLVPARGSVPLYPRRRSKFVKDDSAAVGATKVDKKAAGTGMVKAASWSNFGTCGTKSAAGNKMAPGNKEAAGSFTGEIVVTKAADAGNKEAAGSFTGEIVVTKADAGNKEADGSFIGQIVVAKADAGNKEAAGSFTGEIVVTKADAGNKVAAGSFSGGIDITKAEVGNKEAAGKVKVTEVHWIQFVFPINPPLPVGKAEPVGAMITKEKVPDSFVDILKKRRIFRRMAPIIDTSGVFSEFPKLRDVTQANIDRHNGCIDLHEDVLKQLERKEFAELGVDFTDGVKKVFVLPQDQD